MSQFEMSVTDNGKSIKVKGTVSINTLLAMHKEIINLLNDTSCKYSDLTRSVVALHLIANINEFMEPTTAIKHNDDEEGD
jgi:hypothetical protein